MPQPSTRSEASAQQSFDPERSQRSFDPSQSAAASFDPSRQYAAASFDPSQQSAAASEASFDPEVRSEVGVPRS